MSDPPVGHSQVLPPRPRRTRRDDGSLCLAAPAKLNLDLLVGPRQADGYHPLDSIVAKVTLYDEVVLRPRSDGELRLHVEGADCGPPADNLALRAARGLAQAAGAGCGADILLAKLIPPGRGLGGGSSDAAAVLEGLNELWLLHLPAEALTDLAGRLGSDVPLFLGPPAARMTGRGEELRPVEIHPFVAVLHLPEIACPTGEVYRRFDGLAGARPAMAERKDLALGRLPPSRWRARLRNDLAPAALDISPPLRRLVQTLRESTGLPVSLTGSGSAAFVLCDDAREAAEVLRRLPADLAGRSVLVRPNPW
jgi:4-diphosphocytidyl-2-C-methyl-D-erythritol kinase